MLFSFFLGSRRRPATSAGARNYRARLAVEQLEGRALPGSLSPSAALGSILVASDDALVRVAADGIDDGNDGGDQHDDQATITTTTQFTAIQGATFIDLPASSFLTPVTSGTVTITASNDADGSFFNFPVGTPDAPGSGDGFLAFNHDAFVVAPLTLNFSTPVAAFGVSFMHMAPSIENGVFSSPAVLKVFDGPNGTGNLLGTVTSSGFVPTTTGTLGEHSFVAVLSSARNIRSAVLEGTGPTLGFAVDGYAVSLTPQGTAGH